MLLFNVYAQSFTNSLLRRAPLIRVRACSYFFVEEIRGIWSEGFAVYRQVVQFLNLSFPRDLQYIDGVSAGFVEHNRPDHHSWHLGNRALLYMTLLWCPPATRSFTHVDVPVAV